MIKLWASQLQDIMLENRALRWGTWSRINWLLKPLRDRDPCYTYSLDWLTNAGSGGTPDRAADFDSNSNSVFIPTAWTSALDSPLFQAKRNAPLERMIKFHRECSFCWKIGRGTLMVLFYHGTVVTFIPWRVTMHLRFDIEILQIFTRPGNLLIGCEWND